MRILVLLACTTMLAACGGAGPQTAGGSAPPTGVGGGTGGGGTGGGGTGSGDTHTFANPTEEKTYQAVGASHSYQYSNTTAYDVNDFINDPNDFNDQEYNILADGQSGQIYQGNATTVRNSNLSITYNPRDAIFDISLTDGDAGVSTATRFQDPLHRTDFGGALEPQGGVPQLSTAGMNYLQAGSASNVFFPTAAQGFTGNLSNIAPILVDGENSGSYDVTTFFYQTPGTDTQYVTFAGFLRNKINLTRQFLPDDEIVYLLNPDGTRATDVNGNEIPIGPTSVVNNSYDFERGAFTFGEVTSNSQVPTTGTGTFNGTMLASMVFNNIADITGDASTFFQWIEGTANANFDFGANTFNLALNGTVFAPEFDLSAPRFAFMPGGSMFDATGAGQIDLVGAGGFLGQFDQAWFTTPTNQRIDLVIAGSSVNGAFYGPNGTEIGGSYRIVGGTPDQRIDILGTFVGAQD